MEIKEYLKLRINNLESKISKIDYKVSSGNITYWSKMTAMSLIIEELKEFLNFLECDGKLDALEKEGEQ